MKKIAWITDSTCGLPESFLKEHDVHVLPMVVNINDISYREDVDISKDQVYTLLKEHGEGAKTSQPAFGEFVSLYETLKESYDVGIAIHASSELTGTYQSSLSAAEMVGFPVEVIDSRIGSYALGKMIKNGLELEANGIAFEEVVKTMRGYTEKTEMYLLPESLEQLKRSGRVSTTKATFANLLQINLLLRFHSGKILVEEKIRGKKRANRRLFQIMEQAIQEKQSTEICIIHAGVKEQAMQWKEELEKIHTNVQIKVETLVPVAGVHTGYGTMCVAWLRDR